jgi:lipopolysaccharide transport system ATP-binding protein
VSDVVIRAERLGKKYIIGHEVERERYVALRDVITRNARNLCRKTADMVRGRAIVSGDITEEFWALKDVNFEVKRGEVLGIIGRNGAGKSTLLKVLSRITEPTKGRVEIRGRVASLLEVGTGFHPELTGRENIYLNGAILGMTRAEIQKKFDEIVDFAGVEKFLDTPVKRYSSGMHVRLAFAVAAHLDPEILIVDEVLAVGDAEFQRKCLGKMDQVSKHGRTVLLVSHNMSAIERLCGRAMVLEDGNKIFDGEPASGVKVYLSEGLGQGGELPPPDHRPGSGKARIASLSCTPIVDFGEPLRVEMVVKVRNSVSVPDFRASIYDQSGVCIAHFGTSYLGVPLPALEEDTVVVLELPESIFNFGRYTLNVSISEVRSGEQPIVDRIENAASFQVGSLDPFGTGETPKIGSVILPQRWFCDNRLISSFPFDADVQDRAPKKKA